ncbi:T9SS type A sorting domain-containing protein [Flavobacterium sp.]|uniref:DUF7619 domain-containing protein n=1 Tax=Flavobacterium sp. TaxID=239 RepID=UPI0026191D9F|nr:T9SS type A sorting domain-containing protein [Flavobacterium sp.]
MKKQLLRSFLGFFLLLSVSAFAQPGISCVNPIQINSLPFQDNNNTANFADDFDVTSAGSCGVSMPLYTSGNDVFYSYTPVSDGSIKFSLKPVGSESTYSSIFVFDGCSNVGVNCLSGAANGGTSERLFSLGVLAAHNYIIVVSSRSYTQTVSYSLLVQKEDCLPEPIQNTVSVLGSTSASFNWNGSIYLSSEIAIQPLGMLVPQGNGETVTSLPFTKQGLTPGTQYQYWVRGQCSAGVYTSWAGPFTFTTPVCEASQQCNYTFRLSNINAIGWGTTRMEVRQNGIAVATLGATMTATAPVDVTVPLCNGIPFELYWSVAGTSPQNRAIAIINPFGQTLYYKGPGTGAAGDILYSDTVNCLTPVCQAPNAIIATNVTGNAATLGWNASGAAAVDIYIVPSGNPAPDASTVPTYNNVNASAQFTTTAPLLSDHEYAAYFRGDCGDETSAWVGPFVFHTLETCFNPVNTQVVTSSITTTTATFTWQPGDVSSTQFELILIPGPLTPLMPPDNDTPASYPVITVPAGGPYTFTATDLQSATIYYGYIRTICGAGDVSICTPFPVFNTATCAEADKCNYKFIMTNTAGNSWNNARMQVRQNGIVVATIGATGINSPAGITVALCNGIPFDLLWSEEGLQPTTIGISIRNPFLDEIYTKVPGDGTPGSILYASLGNCIPDSCSKPTNITASDITFNSAILQWTDPSVPIAPAYALYVVPTGQPAPSNNPSTPPTTSPVPNPYTLTGLTPSTSYTVYLKSLCSDSSQSNWTTLTPVTFVTTPVNNRCVDAIAVGVNAGQACAVPSIHGNTYGANSDPSDPQGGISTTGCGTTDDDIWFKFVATATSHAINFNNVLGTPAAAKINHSLFSGSCGSLTQRYCSTALSSTATGLTVGETYYIRVYTSGTNLAQFVDFDLCITSPPANDEPDTATTLQINPAWVCNPTLDTAGNTLGATPSPPTVTGTACGGTDDDVWFRFVATSNIHIIDINDIVSTSATVVLNHSLFSGSTDNLVKLYCSATSESVATGLTVGATYFLRVYTSGTTAGQSSTFNVCLSTPPPPATNDECAAAIMVEVSSNSMCETTTQGSIIGATQSINVPASCLTGQDDDVWFKFTAVSAQQIISLNNVLGTTTNINHAVYTGNCGNLVLKYCGPSNQLTSTAATFVPGEIYYLRVWSNATSSQVVVFDVCIKTVSSCQNAESFCGSSPDDPYIYANTTGVANTSQVACLGSIPNPAYYVLKIDEPGDLVFNVLQNTAFDVLGNPTGANLDVDFVLWGPFENNSSFCSDIDFSDCTTCPNNTNNPAFYPFGNIVDCSYDGSYTETMTINGAVAGQYYVALITNFNGAEGYIRLTQTNAATPGAGTTVCTDKIRLIAYVDANNNGVKDVGELNFTEGTFAYQKNDSGPFGNISSQTGVYDLFSDNPADSYDFTYHIFTEFSAYYSTVSAGFNNITVQTDSGSQLLYFPIVQTQPYDDVSVTVVPMNVARPGSNYEVKIVCKNEGLQTASGTINFVKDPELEIVNVSQPGIVNNSNGFSYDFTGLGAYQTAVIYVNMSVPAIPQVSLGQIVINSVSATTSVTDVHPADNSFSGTSTIVGSYDPNDKMESHGGEIGINELDNGGYLYYTIRFQNTGTYYATDVRLEDTLDEKLDESSVRVLSTSHNYSLIRTLNQLTWQFNNIYLPTAFDNEPESHGYVTFKVKPKQGYAVGDIISNTAEIYFDTNPAIVTNTVQTEVSTPLGTPVFDNSNVALYPNPANTIVNINLQYTSENLVQVTLFDMLGKAVRQVKANNPQHTTVDVSGLAKGMYMVEIKTESDLKLIKKLILN